MTAITAVRTTSASLPFRALHLNAGLTATLFYVFGPVPLYLSTARLYAGNELALSGFVVVFATSAIGTAAMSLKWRQPLALGWSMPGLLFIAASAERYPLAEVAAASLVASLAVAAISLAGFAERLQRVIPLPVAMAMLAGSAIHLCVAPFTALGEDPAIVGAALGGFLLARQLGHAWFPPAAGAVLLGLPAAMLFGSAPHIDASLAMPSLAPLSPEFAPATVTALALPLAVFILVGNTQGTSVLSVSGFNPPVRAIGVITGAMGVVHALFCAPPASMQRVAMAVLSGDEAGPRAERWAAAVLASAGLALIVIFAAPLDLFTGSLHPAFVSALIGLVLLKVVTDALRRTTADDSLAGPLAFFIAASQIELAGLTPEFWALIVGCAVAYAPSAREAQQPTYAPARPAAGTAPAR